MFKQNKHCYDFQLRTYDNEIGLFDNFVDVTYIITSKDSTERNIHIETELKKRIPTKQIYFVYNPTYKKCKKVLPEQIPPYDLKDTNLNIMQHSIDHNYNNILILENDFIYSDVILNPTKNTKIIKEIQNFCEDYSNQNLPVIYNIGIIVMLVYPHLNLFSKHINTFESIVSVSNQAVIYNKKVQMEILKEPKNMITRQFKDIDKNIDMYLNINFHVYFYKTPLIYQIFPATENSKYWSENKIINYLLNNRSQLLQLDKTPEPGFFINNLFAFCISYGLILVLIVFLYRFSTKKNMKIKRK